jgi:ketosteroid isomerase-like protein
MPSRIPARFSEALALLAVLVPLGACGSPSASAAPTAPSSVATIAKRPPTAARAESSPQERAVLAAMASFKQAIIDANVDELARTWTDDYTFINPQGAIVTRAQRLANLASGNTDVNVIDDEREITVRVYGDMAVVQNLSTLHGRFNGVPTDTDLRGTFVWVRRNGRWQLVTNQLTAVS